MPRNSILKQISYRFNTDILNYAVLLKTSQKCNPQEVYVDRQP